MGQVQRPRLVGSQRKAQGMRRLLLVLAALLMACSCGSSAPKIKESPHGSGHGFGPRGAEEQVRVMLSRTVKIQATSCDDGGGNHSGSGVIVGTGLVATAKHVIDRDCRYYVIGADGRSLLAFHPKLHDTADVGTLVVVDIGIWDPIPMANPRLGEPIFALGHPRDLLKGKTWLTVTRGVVAAKYDDQEFRFTAPIYPGNSGGPIFDRHGRLVGIISAMMARNGQPFDGMYYAVDMSALVEILPEHGYNSPAKEAGKVRKHK